MINKNIIIGLVALVIIVGGIFLIFKDKAVSVTGASDIIADWSELTELQTNTGLSQNTTGFTNYGTALRAFGRASYRVEP